MDVMRQGCSNAYCARRCRRTSSAQAGTLKVSRENGPLLVDRAVIRVRIGRASATGRTAIAGSSAQWPRSPSSRHSCTTRRPRGSRRPVRAAIGHAVRRVPPSGFRSTAASTWSQLPSPAREVATMLERGRTLMRGRGPTRRTESRSGSAGVRESRRRHDPLCLRRAARQPARRGEASLPFAFQRPRGQPTLPQQRFHDLRHAHATLLIEGGCAALCLIRRARTWPAGWQDPRQAGGARWRASGDARCGYAWWVQSPNDRPSG